MNSLSYDWGQYEEWDISSDKLISFVNILAEQLKEDAIIIAANTCNSVDPYTYFVYSFGDGVKIKMFDSDPFGCFDQTFEEYLNSDDDYEDEDRERDLKYKFEMSKLHNLYHQTSIKNIAEVLSYKNWFVFTDKELSILKSFGIKKRNTKKGPKYSDVNANNK